MEIIARKTQSFIELKVDITEDTIFKSHQLEINDTIHNLLDVVEDLISYTDTNLVEILKKRGDIK